MTKWTDQLYMLNNNQKRFLFYEGYLSGEALSADTFKPDWKEYYVCEFNWYLHNPETSNLIRLDLIHKTSDACNIKDLYIDMTDHNKEFLLNIKDESSEKEGFDSIDTEIFKRWLLEGLEYACKDRKWQEAK